jgi:hypothetical protein
MRALVFAVALQVGCSWTFVESPPPADPLPGTPLTCTDSNVYPALDFVWAGVYGLTAFGFLFSSLFVAVLGEDDVLATRLFFAGAGTGAAAGLHVWSAIDGAVDTSRCKELKLKLVPEDGRPLK